MVNSDKFIPLYFNTYVCVYSILYEHRSVQNIAAATAAAAAKKKLNDRQTLKIPSVDFCPNIVLLVDLKFISRKVCKRVVSISSMLTDTGVRNNILYRHYDFGLYHVTALANVVSYYSSLSPWPITRFKHLIFSSTILYDR